MAEVDVVVVGAGPAGLQAAAEAARAGASVCLLDRASQLGGQYWHHLPPEFRTESPGAVQHQWATAERAFRTVRALESVDVRLNTAVWAAERDADAIRLHGDGASTVTGGTVVLATGSHERVLPFPGWDLPGVMTAGAAQTLVKGQGILPGHRIVVAGSGPLLLPATTVLVRCGAEIAGLVEATGPADWAREVTSLALPSKLLEAGRHAAALARHRVPVVTRAAVVAAVGTDHVEAVRVAPVDHSWRTRTDTVTELGVDALCVSFGFVANLELAEQLGCRLTNEPPYAPAVAVDARQSTSVPQVYAAGETTGIAGAACARAEGTIAGLAAAAATGHTITTRRAALRTALHTRRRERRFAGGLARTFRVRSGWTSWLPDETIVCRCEETTAGTIRAACQNLGARDLRSVKLTTRVGMGRCQGRMCAPGAAGIVMAQTGTAPPDAPRFARRPVATPTRLGDL